MIAPLICEKFLVRDQTTKLPLFCQGNFYKIDRKFLFLNLGITSIFIEYFEKLTRY